MLFLILSSCDSRPSYEPPVVRGDVVVVDAGSLQDAKPRFYTYRVGKKRVSFFVVKINGSVESYLDACTKCYGQKKGYRVEGFHLVCKACNVRYPMDSLKTGIGSCYPIPLKGKLTGNEYRIDTAELRKGARYF